MDKSQISAIAEMKAVLAEDWESIRQLRPQSESTFIAFARNRGIEVKGVLQGDPGRLHAEGRLCADELDQAGQPLFHPFRVYPLHILSNPHRGALPGVSEEANAIADLAILLEPVYWPNLVGKYSRDVGITEDEYWDVRSKYQIRVKSLLKELDLPYWSKQHELLRIEALWLDRNADLYVLLRLSKWERREALTGRISGALWIRHMAEVIRRGFEIVFGIQWEEEDRASGEWMPGGRKLSYGSERPLDSPIRSGPYISYRYGLRTGSAVRWYVEGETEYGLVTGLLGEPSVLGVEVLNLRGQIGNGSHALGLEGLLKEDCELRRFSILTFDTDGPFGPRDRRSDTVRTVQSLARQDLFVGSIDFNDPDLEFANFSLEELVEIAAQFDEERGFAADCVRNADWNGVASGKGLEKRYREVSSSKKNLKSVRFGALLAEWAAKHPVHPHSKESRRILQSAFAARSASTSNYDRQRERFTFDPETLKLVERKKSPADS